MEEDQQFIKKLMSMMGNGKELKIKSATGQTLKISLDGSCYNDTQSGEDSATPAPQISHKKKSPQSGGSQQFLEEPFSVQDSSGEQVLAGLKNDLQKIEEDFIALQGQNCNTQEENLQYNLDTLQNPAPSEKQSLPCKIDFFADLKNSSSKNEDSIFKQFLLGSPSKDQPRKIQLSKKKKEVTNQPVLNFFKEEHKLGDQGSLLIGQVQEVSSSPVICRTEEVRPDLEIGVRSSEEVIGQERDLKGCTSVKEEISRLRERHPEEGQLVEMIHSRINKLEELEQSISRINSSISNSLNLSSFDVSMLSFNRNSSDPLCMLMAQFVGKQRQGKASSYSRPSSSFLFMYSQPLLTPKGKELTQQIDYFEEEATIQKILKEGKCQVNYIHSPGTLQKLHYWLTQGVEILHFSGHGVEHKQQNYLVFQTEQGISRQVTGKMLSELLNGKQVSLKLVFVASCHSQSTGRVFSQAGASHVICVRDEYQILDQACLEFVRLFYLTCINNKTTICQAFEFAKKQLVLSGKFTKHECEKFRLIVGHQGPCKQHFQNHNDIAAFSDVNQRPHYSQHLLSKVENYIPRCRQIHQILSHILKKKRFITIVGQPGLGKSTLARQLVRYLLIRNFFQDGVVYLEIGRCETMAKVFEVLDLQFFETPQMKLNKTPGENAHRLAKELGDQRVLIVLDNCQAIMASEDRQNFKRLSEIIMKNCPNVYFIFTNRHSISRQIDYCSQVLLELDRLTQAQAEELFFSKAPRCVPDQELKQFFKLDPNCNSTKIALHSFFQFLNGHPQAICLTASLLAQRSLSELHCLLLQPTMGQQLERGGVSVGMTEYGGINKVVSTAMRISLNVIHHKYKEASEMIKVLSLLPNGLESDMMQKVFPEGGKWKLTVRKLMSHSLVQCIEKGGCRYYMVHPQIIVDIEKEMSEEDRYRYHDVICRQIERRITKIYRNAGTSAPTSQRAQELFLIEEDNFKAIFLRELSFLQNKYPLRKFYENLFRVQFEGLDEEERNQFGDHKIKTEDILAMVEASGKKKTVQSERNVQQKNPLDQIMVYYITVLFVLKKTKSPQLDTYLDYGLLVALKKSKHLVVANLLRLKACVYHYVSNDQQAKQFFQLAHSEFAQLGCGLGSACCEAALGYIKMYESEYAPAKKNLQNALKYYDEIPHPFGKHYLNRWLCNLKAKINREQKELIYHKEQAAKLLKETKQNLRANNIHNASLIKHKFGYFPFRFLLDNMSLFLEATFDIDLRPKFIPKPAPTPYTPSILPNQNVKKYVKPAENPPKAKKQPQWNISANPGKDAVWAPTRKDKEQ